TVRLPPSPAWRLVEHGVDQNVCQPRGRVRITIEVDLRRKRHFDHLQATVLGITEFVRDPNIAETVDCETAARPAGLEGLSLRWIASRKAGDVIAEDVGNPDVVLLVDGKRERRQHLTGISEWIATRAKDLSLGRITLGKMNQLVAQRVGGPHIPAGRDDDALH